MFTIETPIMQRACLLAACVFGLTGCAYETATLDPAATIATPFIRAPGKDGVQEKLRVDNALTLAEKNADYSGMNPVPILFDKFTVKLDENGRHVIEQISERAKEAHTLVITGYCDRHQIGNANAAAIARATAVRDELLHLGIPARKVKIKHVTNVPDRHEADIEF
jgi:outer membrane protein OmpA-like peptidoglycan-associated protein